MTPKLTSESKINAYDAHAEQIGYLAPEVVFGLSYQFVNAGDTLLDIGIGTGLSSLLFHKAGLQVVGMDLSPEMLDLSRSKKFTKELKVHDLMVKPYPFNDASIDHAVCIGVLLHFQEIKVLFDEVGRIIRDGGIFAFMVADRAKGEECAFTEKHKPDSEEKEVTLYRHDAEYIHRLLTNNHLVMQRELAFRLTIYCDITKTCRSKVYIARKQKHQS